VNQQILLSIDYELFFGPQTGTVEHCLLRPTEALAEAVGRYGARLSLFVDALYLQRLSDETLRHPQLQRDYDAIRRQLVSLRQKGHDVQLHIHPHWLDSHFNGNEWKLDTTRYKLQDFFPLKITTIIGSAKKLLASLVGDTIFVFRAGGWCLQPFATIAPALLAHDIWLDSTVFAGGVSDDKERWFDFSSAPLKDYWHFSEDPNCETPYGPFIEVPISAMRVTPLLFWSMVFARKFGANPKYTPFGDGSSLAWGKNYYYKRLTRSSISVASLDGLKAGLLSKAFHTEQNAGKRLFQAMGHPKALSRFSLLKIEEFLAGVEPFTSVTFQDFKHLRPGTGPHLSKNPEKEGAA
jgi:hypothetical protein